MTGLYFSKTTWQSVRLIIRSSSRLFTRAFNPSVSSLSFAILDAYGDITLPITGLSSSRACPNPLIRSSESSTDSPIFLFSPSLFISSFCEKNCPFASIPSPTSPSDTQDTQKTAGSIKQTKKKKVGKAYLATFKIPRITTAPSKVFIYRFA